MRTLKGKVVMITGAGSGLGRAMALEIAVQGGVPVIADINEDGMKETAVLVRERGATCSTHHLDVRKAENWDSVLAEVEKIHGGLDVIINNAGVFSRAENVIDVATEHCQFVMDVNFWGAFYGTRAAIPYLAKRPEGHIVNTASAMALIGSPMHAVYSASKAAVANFTAVLREELRGTRINVTTVFPGGTKTGLAKNVQVDNEEQRTKNSKNFERFPLNSPEAVARAVVKGIVGNKSNVVTGVDGRMMSVLQRLAPSVGYRSVSTFYRKVSDPGLFASLDRMR